MLKLNFPEDESTREADALAHWRGEGAVRLLEVDRDRNALLVERADPGTSLWEVGDDEEATLIAASVFRRLWSRPPPDGHPFRVLLSVRRADTGKSLSGGTVTCSAKAGSKALQWTSKVPATSGVASCTWALPKASKKRPLDRPASCSRYSRSTSVPTPTTFHTPAASATVSPTNASGSASAAKPSAPTAPAAPAASDNRSTLANNVLNVAGLGDPDRGERAVALAGASAIVIGWWLLSTRAVRMPQLLGALGGGRVETLDNERVAPKTHVGGVGRFARNRITTARRLR